jgi:pimeloyl-ACP methyl ester carboxylesterase
VNIHYVTKGVGPVIIFLHGFPDLWYTWKYQMDNLSDTYKVVGIDLRGYNLSDRPKGVDNYKMKELMSDLVAVIDHFDASGSLLVANDWGGMIAWYTAIFYPHKVKGLVACNVPHPLAFSKYLSENPSTGNYTNNLIADNALEVYTPERLVEIAKPSESLKKQYLEAFKRTDVEAILNYYKANYPKPPSNTSPSPNNASATIPPLNNVQCKVLMIHGLDDKAFPPGSLNNNWEFIDKDFTLFAIKGAGHFIQREAPEKVYETILYWLEVNSYN